MGPARFFCVSLTICLWVMVTSSNSPLLISDVRSPNVQGVAKVELEDSATTRSRSEAKRSCWEVTRFSLPEAMIQAICLGDRPSPS